MVSVENGKCTTCGLCAEICHEQCISVSDGGVEIDFELCSTCTQCIAICPQRALSWNNTPPVVFEHDRLPSAGRLDELFKERRTIRFFKETKIDRVLLEEIVGYGIYAPTHNFDLRAVIVDDPEIIGLVDRVILKFVSKLYSLFFKSKIVANIMRRLPSPYRSEFIKAKPKLVNALTTGKALGSRPAAVIFLVGDKRVPLSVESAQYSLYNISLYSQARGIGCRNLVGNQMILNRSREIRNLLRLDRHERIFGTIGVGYPAVKFRNKVTGRKLKIQWNSG